MAKKLETKTPAGGVFKFIGRDSLKQLLREVRTLESKGAEFNGKLGELLKSAEEKKNLHRPAFRTAARLERMEPSKLRTFLAHLDYYREQFKLDEIAEQQGDFVADQEDAEREEKREAAAGKKKSSAKKTKRKTMGEKLREPGAPLAEGQSEASRQNDPAGQVQQDIREESNRADLH